MPTYKNADGSFTTVPEGGGAPIRSPVAPTGSSPVPVNEGLAALMANRLLSKQPVVVPLGDKPLPPPDNKLLVPREDGKFDEVVLGEDGHTTGVVGPEAALKMQKEGGYRLLNPRTFNTEPEGLRNRLATILDRNPATEAVESTVGVPMRDGTVRQVAASKAREALASPEAAPVTTVPSHNEEWRQIPKDFPGFGGDPARMVLNAQGQWTHPEAPPGSPRAPSPEEQKAVDESFAKHELDAKLAANPLESFFKQTGSEGQPQQPATSTTVKESHSGPGFAPKKTDLGMKDFEEAQRLKASALDTAQSFEEGRAERQRMAMEAAQTEDDKLRAEQQELERQKQEKVNEATQKYTSMLEESQKPGGQLDSGRWWNSRGTGQKVAAVLGQALASFSAGMQGRGPVDMIGKFVEEDLQLQQAQLARDDAKQRQGLEAQGKILALTEKQYGDPVQAKAAARAMVWENMDRQLALGEARAGTDAAKAKYAGLRASVAEEAAKAKSDLVLRTEQLHLAQSANAREWKQLQLQEQSAATAAANKAATINFEKLEPGTPIPISMLPEGLKKRALPVGNGNALLALDDKRAEEASKKLEAADSLLDKVSQLQKIRSEFGSTVSPSDLKRMRGIQKEIIVEYGRAKGLGALDNGTVTIGEEITGGDPGAWRPGIDDAISAFGQRIAADRLRTISNATGAVPGNFQPK